MATVRADSLFVACTPMVAQESIVNQVRLPFAVYPSHYYFLLLRLKSAFGILDPCDSFLGPGT